jgi:deoxyribonuclease-4
MRFGFHISIAGGFSKVVERAEIRGCETIQFFSRNPRGWRYDPLDKNDVGAFRSSIKTSALFPVFLHLPYLANIACPRSRFYTRSVKSIVTDLKRAEQLGAQYLIIHIGHRMESSEEEAIEAVSKGINQAFDKVNLSTSRPSGRGLPSTRAQAEGLGVHPEPGSSTLPSKAGLRVAERVKNSVILLLENTAGQGTEIGHSFDQIKKIIDGVNQNEKIGVVLDTAHTFEAGYDLSKPEGAESMLESFEKTIGLKRLRLLHLNDSKTPLGSRKDRHWHIGEGYIGKEGFRYLINHPSIRALPGIMETPRKDTVEDLKNMKVIRSLVG